MEPNVLKRIFFNEYQDWENFKTKHNKNIHEVALNKVEEFRGCGDPINGFKLLVCEGCHDLRKVSFRCKGRFCTTGSMLVWLGKRKQLLPILYWPLFRETQRINGCYIGKSVDVEVYWSSNVEPNVCYIYIGKNIFCFKSSQATAID